MRGTSFDKEDQCDHPCQVDQGEDEQLQHQQQEATPSVHDNGEDSWSAAQPTVYNNGMPTVSPDETTVFLDPLHTLRAAGALG